MYRDPDHGLVAGVCAGLAEALGISRFFVRVLALIALLLHPLLTLAVYLVLAFTLQRPPRLERWERRLHRADPNGSAYRHR